MITMRSVGYEYGSARGPVRALDGVSFDVRPGEFVALVGANGSGKSTLARLCDGLLVPTSGVVEVDGLDTRDSECTWDVRRRVGLVLQDPDDQIVGTSVQEDTAFGPENLGVPPAQIRERVDECLATVGLTGIDKREPHLLSEGQKQRLAVAGALAMRPRYLVMDEATSMLDPAGRADVLELLRRLARDGTGIVHVTHRLDELADADRVAVLSQGRLVFEGAPTELLADVDLMGTCGLSVPPVWRLAHVLRDAGIHLSPHEFDPASIAEAIRC
jgi:energy-coupling factor transport system ATP-binding protein